MVTFLEYKNKVLELFDNCISFARQNGFEGYLDAMKACKVRVEDDKLTIVTVGEARRGKSLLLTAYLEDEGLFPIDVGVTTCLASAVSYGEKERITVTFTDGKKKTISRDEIKNYATELLNKNNKKEARLITVDTPNPKLKDGVIVVDTPGVGSLNPQHTEVTYSYLPNADIVLFVSDIGAELTKPELVFLRSIRKHCENLLFVLTKIDINENYELILSANIDKIQEFAGIPREKIQYIPVSSVNKLEGLRYDDEYLIKASNFNQLDEAIWDTVMKKRVDIIISPPLADLETILKNIAKEIQIQITGLSGNRQEQSELAEKLGKLQKQRQALSAKNAQWKTDLKHQIDQIGITRSNRFTDFMHEATSLMDSLNNQSDYLQNPPLIANAIEQLAQVTANEIDNDVFDRLYGIEIAFQKEIGLGLYDSAVRGGLADTVPTAHISVQRNLKPSMLRTTLEAASNILFWPLSMMLRQHTEKMWNKMDEKRVSYRKLEEYGPKHIPQIRAEVTKYIQMCVSMWRGEHSKFMNDITYRFMSNMEKAIIESRDTIERDLKEFETTVRQNVETCKKAEDRLVSVRTNFERLLTNLKELRHSEIGKEYAPDVSPKQRQSTDRNIQKPDVQIPGGMKYSHLED